MPKKSPDSYAHGMSLTSRQGSLDPKLHHDSDIQILLEYTWMIPKVGKDQIIKGHLAWANGDTTGMSNLFAGGGIRSTKGILHFPPGYGMHADFVNGQVGFKPTYSSPANLHLGPAVIL
jgi:hypothetical protein